VVRQFGNHPGGRQASAFWTDGNKHYLFGGYGVDVNGDIGYLNDLWVYDMASEAWTWIGGPSTRNDVGDTNYPRSRTGATSWVDNNGNFWMFGGASGAGRLRDLWKYVPGTDTWSLEYGSTGGQQVGSFSGTQYPGCRNLGGGWVDDNNNLWLFGGNGKTTGSRGDLADLWKYSISNGTWEFISSASSDQIEFTGTFQTIPSARLGATFFKGSDGTLYMFGGEGPGYRLSWDYYNYGPGSVYELTDGVNKQLWSFDPTTEEWSILYNFETEPQTYVTEDLLMMGYGFENYHGRPHPYYNKTSPRSSAAGWATSDGIFIFGGYGIARSWPFEYWGPTNFSQHQNPPSGYLNDLVKIYYGTNTLNVDVWLAEDLNGDGGINYGYSFDENTATPSSRDKPAFWTDSNGDLWLFGGGGSGYKNDLWVYRNDQWTWVNGPKETNQPGTYGTIDVTQEYQPGSRKGSMAWNRGDETYIFGGYGYSESETLGYLQDVFKYNKRENVVTEVESSTGVNAAGIYIGNEVPGAREHGRTWVDSNGDMWLFGGYGYDENGQEGFLNDLWKYNPDSGWDFVGGSSLTDQNEQISGAEGVEDPGNWPSGLSEALMWQLSDGTIYLYGGYKYSSNFGGYLVFDYYNTDLWKFNPGTGQWTWEGTYSYGDVGDRTTPRIRVGSFTWVVNDKLYLYGGATDDFLNEVGTGFSAETLVFDPESGLWQYLTTGSIDNPDYIGSPNTMNGFSWVDEGGDLWAFGGVLYDQNVVGAGGASNEVYNSFWKFDLGLLTWTSIQDPGYFCGSPGFPGCGPYFTSLYGSKNTGSVDNKPIQRDGPNILGYDDNTLFLFGGNSVQGYHDDVWKVNFLPGGPNLLEENITQTSFTINWEQEVRASSYEVQISANSDLSIPFADVTGIGSFSYLQETLTPGQTYYYQIRAQNEFSAGTESYTEIQTVQLRPDDPVLIEGQVSQTTLALSWNQGGETGRNLGVDNFILEGMIEGSPEIVFTTDTLTLNSENVTVENITPGTNYEVLMRSNNQSGNSENSNLLRFLTKPADPVISGINDVTNNQLTVSWSSVTGSDDYTVDISTDNLSSILRSETVVQSSDPSITFDNLTANQNYTVQVTANNNSGSSFPSISATTRTATNKPIAPNVSNVTTTGFNVNWTVLTGVSKYIIDISNDNFVSIIKRDTSGTNSFKEFTGFDSGQEYQIRLQTLNEFDIPSEYSNTVTTILVPVPPSNTTFSNITQESVDINWDQVNGATAYQIDISSNNFQSFVTGYNGKSLTGNQTTVTGLEAGKEYQVRIRSLNGNGLVSSNSETFNFPTVPLSPFDLSSTEIKQSGFDLNWTLVNEATGYKVEISQDTFKTILLTSDVSSSPLQISGLTAGSNYQARILSYNNSGESDYSKNLGVLTLPETPQIQIISNITQTSLNITWNSVTCDAYELELSTDNFLSLVVSYDPLVQSGSSVVVQGLRAGISYQARVRAKNSSGISANSEDTTFVMVPSAPLAISAS
jgi:hypothetical protein